MLTVVATPIGNHADITLRALDLLKSCEAIIGEDHRVTSTLIKKLGLPNRDKDIYLLNEHTRKADLDELLELCRKKNVALITDCGTPGFSDPGADLIRLCRMNNISVTTAPGASSLMALLSLSSKKIEQFLFVGFLPAQNDERRKRLHELKSEKNNWVLMDTPYRLQAVLSDLKDIMPNQKAILGLNLTQSSEQVLEGSLKEIATQCTIKEAEFILLRYRI